MKIKTGSLSSFEMAKFSAVLTSESEWHARAARPARNYIHVM